MAGGNGHVLLSKVALKSQDPNLVSWGLGVPAVGGDGGKICHRDCGGTSNEEVSSLLAILLVQSLPS